MKTTRGSRKTLDKIEVLSAGCVVFIRTMIFHFSIFGFKMALLQINNILLGPKKAIFAKKMSEFSDNNVFWNAKYITFQRSGQSLLERFLTFLCKSKKRYFCFNMRSFELKNLYDLIHEVILNSITDSQCVYSEITLLFFSYNFYVIFSVLFKLKIDGVNLHY